MGLDKWLQSEKTEKRKKKESVAVVSEDKELDGIKEKVKESHKTLSKFTLICTNSKCKYQKLLMKRALNNKDKICPKCNNEMKVKK
ncbi:MAG: hypothetical protein EU542_00765 [Promethearchaeota archaeon]|nr:MAG: hypothetical protein EU542_00765 [Candidatus Lokiarchaeota archaeon]